MEREDWLDSSDPRHAAAAWHALMQSEAFGEGERRKFADWLCKSPSNVAEYLRLIGVQDQLRDPAVFEDISLDALQAQIGANVKELPRFAGMQEVEQLRERLPRGRGRWFSFGLAAIVLFTLTFALKNTVLKNESNRYTTAIGEQRSIVLPDSSIAEMNTRSSLEVRFTALERDIVLNDGTEALFRVAKDAQRPFRVRSGTTIVQAVGTEFTVRRELDRTTVTVLEGRVRVTESQSTARPVELTAGQRLASQTNKPLGSAPIESIVPEVAVAWKTRRLVFDDLPIEAVIAEFNRYNQKQIALGSVPSGMRRITGVFNANDPDSFLDFLKQSQGQPGDSPHQGSQSY